MNFQPLNCHSRPNTLKILCESVARCFIIYAQYMISFSCSKRKLNKPTHGKLFIKCIVYLKRFSISKINLEIHFIVMHYITKYFLSLKADLFAHVTWFSMKFINNLFHSDFPHNTELIKISSFWKQAKLFVLLVSIVLCGNVRLQKDVK